MNIIKTDWEGLKKFLEDKKCVLLISDDGDALLHGKIERMGQIIRLHRTSTAANMKLTEEATKSEDVDVGLQDLMELMSYLAEHLETMKEEGCTGPTGSTNPLGPRFPF